MAVQSRDRPRASAQAVVDATFVQTSMHDPVTDAAMDTTSNDEFAEGYHLTRKATEWFWDAHTTDPRPAGPRRAHAFLDRHAPTLNHD